MLKNLCIYLTKNIMKRIMKSLHLLDEKHPAASTTWWVKDGNTYWQLDWIQIKMIKFCVIKIVLLIFKDPLHTYSPTNWVMSNLDSLSLIFFECQSLIYPIWDSKFVITGPADGLALNSARPSAGTVLTIKLDIFSSKFLFIPLIGWNSCLQDDSIQNSKEILQNLTELWMISSHFIRVTSNGCQNI